MRRWVPWIVFAGAAALVGCAAGPESEWAAEGADPAGFWAGLWHGALLVIALVVSFFTDDVSIFEANNVGTAYEIGFVLGVLIIYGSGFRVTAKKSHPERKDDIGRKIDQEIRRRVARMIDEDEDWQELGEKIERKVKEKLRRWLEADEEKA